MNSVPTEVLAIILKKIGLRDLRAVRACSTNLYWQSQDESVWEHRYRVDFPNFPHSDLSLTWLASYQVTYRELERLIDALIEDSCLVKTDLLHKHRLRRRIRNWIINVIEQQKDPIEANIDDCDFWELWNLVSGVDFTKFRKHYDFMYETGEIEDLLLDFLHKIGFE